MKKNIVVGAFFAILITVVAFAGQSLRWYGLREPALYVETCNGPSLDVAEYKVRYKDIEFDANKMYYYQWKVQAMYTRGKFPFASLKTDTLSKDLMTKDAGQ